MTTEEKKAKIKSLVMEMANDSVSRMPAKIDTLFHSGAIDFDKWDGKNTPMIIPKCIILALFESESTQYDARNTGYEKQVKKEVRKFRYYI